MNGRTLGIASLVVVLTACSSQPRQPAAPAPVAAAATPVSSPAGSAPPVNRTLIAAGYKPTTINGAFYYCRTEPVTNTAFKKKVCLNETQIKDQERKTQEMQREMIRSQPNPSCLGPTCAGG